MTEWIIAIVVLAVSLYAIWRAPLLLESRILSSKRVSRCADQFYGSAEQLTANKQTPTELLQFLRDMNSAFGDPRIVRSIVMSAFTGKLVAHSSNPPPLAREFMKAFNNAPSDVQDQFVTAVAASLLASAERSTVFGVIFLRFMLFNPTAQKRSDGLTYASELRLRQAAPC